MQEGHWDHEDRSSHNDDRHDDHHDDHHDGGPR
jgi:hypothetical protein